MFYRFLLGILGLLFFTTTVTPQSGRLIHGRIIDAQTGRPLPGANIFALPSRTSEDGTISDATGQFALTVFPDTHDSLRIRFMGYRTLTLPISALTSDLQVRLEPTTVLFREVVVTATRQPSPAANVPVATEVIEVASPALSTRQTVGEILTEAQSVFIQDQGGINSLKTISLRGAKATQVLILQDNFRLNNPQNGLVDLSVLPLLGIDRIEIARGSSSAQYGSEAIGGVVHLRTLSPPNGFSGNVEYALGDFGTNIKRLRLGHAAGAYSAVLSYGLVRSDGDFKYKLNNADSIRRNNALDRREIYLRAEVKFSPAFRATAFHQNVDNAQGAPGPVNSFFLSTTANQKDKNHLTGLSCEWRQNQFVQLNVQASWQKLDQTYAEPAFAFTSHHKVDGREFILHNRSQLHCRFDLLYGVEFSRYALASTDLGKPQRDQRGAFIQAEWRYRETRENRSHEWLIMPAMRFDDYSDAGSRFSPKLGMSWRQMGTVGIAARASIGQSFRVANMNELFWPLTVFDLDFDEKPDTVYCGNSDLKPETGINLDGGIVVQFSRAGHWQVELGGFYSTLKNLITDAPDPICKTSPKNIEKARLRGIEPALAWHSAGDLVKCKIAYTYLKATDETAARRGKKLAYRPQDKLDASFGLNLAQVHWGVAYQFVGRRFDTVNNKWLPAYWLANLSIGREIRWGNLRASLSAEARNLFDNRFSILDGYPMPGREFRASFKLGI